MNIFLKINFLIFSFLISSCSSGNNVEKSSNKLDERIYVFEKKSNLESSSEINYSRFAPVNQLNLKGMPVDFRKIINILEKKDILILIKSLVLSAMKLYRIIQLQKKYIFLIMAMKNQTFFLKSMQRAQNLINLKVFV